MSPIFTAEITKNRAKSNPSRVFPVEHFGDGGAKIGDNFFFEKPTCMRGNNKSFRFRSGDGRVDETKTFSIFD